MLVWPWLPANHAFTQFLTELTHDDDCDPVPDILEQANDSRLFAAFNNTSTCQNGSARLRKFEQLIKHHRRAGATVLSSSVQTKSSCCVVFLHNSSGVPLSSDRRIMLREAPKDTTPIELPGCIQQPQY